VKESDGTLGFDPTSNPGGEYRVVISNSNTFPNGSRKSDNFKIRGQGTCTEETCGPSQAQDLTVSKTAAGSNDKKFVWSILKDVDKTKVTQVGGTATFNYTVTVSHDAGTISNVHVSGKITVSNPNADGVAVTGITDQLSDGTTCTVTNGAAQNLASGNTEYSYSCDLDALPAGPLDNTATVSWDAQTLTGGTVLAKGSAHFGVEDIDFAETVIDGSLDVTDTFNGTGSSLGTVTAAQAPKEIKYPRTVNIPAYGCLSYDNTASFITNNTGATGSAGRTITVCGPIRTGALTIGFWQNKNGQEIITSQAKTGVCPSATWLRGLAPFQDLSATATCAQVGTYVTNVIKSANASGAAMNAMLKAQMLATALDVYFSNPALGGNKIGAPAGQPLGDVAIDLTKVCKNIGTCSVFENTSSAFGGATSRTVSQLLAYAASQSNVGGSAWYGQVKATQELAKDTFDAINNQVAVAP